MLDLVNRSIRRITRNSVRLNRYYFVAQPVPDSPTAASGRPSKYCFRRAKAIDAIIASAPRPRSVLERRFLDGATCIVAECDGQLAGFIWIIEREYMEDEVRCLYRLNPAAKAAWDFDVYVAPPFRATRLFARLWDAANEWLRSRGCRWTFSRISGFNVASLQAHRRLHAIRLASGTFLTAGPVQLSVFSIRPYLHLSLTRRDFPLLQLPADVDALASFAQA